jgi:hypothetical protein
MEENREAFSQPPEAADTALQVSGRSAILEQNSTASASAKVQTFASARPGCLDDTPRVMRQLLGNSKASNEPSSSMPVQRSSKPSFPGLAPGGGSKNRRTTIVKSNPDKPESKPESKPTPDADKSESKPVSKPAAKDDLKSLPMPELMKKLGSSADGLTQAEAQKRQAQYGPNQITEKKTNEFLKFLTYFWGPIPWMIEAAVILSALVQHWLDFFIILLLLCSNAVVGFLGRTPGGKRHRRSQGQAGDQGQGQARWQVGGSQCE